MVSLSEFPEYDLNPSIEETLSLALELVTPPTQEPLTLDQAKEQLRVTHNLEDDYITGLITVAREAAENDHLFRSLLTQTWRMYRISWVGMYFDRSPLQSVESVKYVDTAGVLQTLDTDNYLVCKSCDPPTIIPAHGVFFPEIRSVGISETNGFPIMIEYNAGYGDNPEDIPSPIIHGMKILITELYNNRQDSIPSRVELIPHGVERCWRNYVDRRFRP